MFLLQFEDVVGARVLDGKSFGYWLRFNLPSSELLVTGPLVSQWTKFHRELQLAAAGEIYEAFPWTHIHICTHGVKRTFCGRGVCLGSNLWPAYSYLEGSREFHT